MTTLTFEQIDRIAAEYFDKIVPPGSGYKVNRLPRPLSVVYEIVHIDLMPGAGFYEQWQYRISQLENGEVVYGPVTALDPDKYSHAVITCAELEQLIHQGEERAAAVVAPTQQQTVYAKGSKQEQLNTLTKLYYAGKKHREMAKATSMSVSNVKIYLNELGLVKHRQK